MRQLTRWEQDAGIDECSSEAFPDHGGLIAPGLGVASGLVVLGGPEPVHLGGVLLVGQLDDDLLWAL